MLIFFYTSTSRAFRTTTIGYLHELSQTHDVLVLTEKLDLDLQNLLDNREIFPRIKSFIPVNQYAETKNNIFLENLRLKNIATDLFRKFTPGLVVASSDVHSLFELYLMRAAKFNNVKRITLQDTLTVEMDKIAIWCDLQNLYLKTSNALPYLLRFIMVKIRKYIGHFFYYIFLPACALNRPFFGLASYILHIGNSGARDSNFHVVFSNEQRSHYISSGVNQCKLKVIPHPFTRESRFILDKLTDKNKNCNYKKVLILLPFENFGFRRLDMSLITSGERAGLQLWLIESISKHLPDWKLIVKPHPLFKSIENVRTRFPEISNIEIVDPVEPVDDLVKGSDLIIDFPRSASTAAFFAGMLYSDKHVFSIDMDSEFLGDNLKNTGFVTYITTKDQFVNHLININNNDGVPRTNKVSYSRYDYENLCSLISDL